MDTWTCLDPRETTGKLSPETKEDLNGLREKMLRRIKKDDPKWVDWHERYLERMKG